MERLIQTETEPLVSVIIPVYNVAPYLREALDSVIHQTYEKLEILVIDDGSDDGSENICDEYAQRDSRIRVIHQENRGLSAARNTGLDHMTGEVVAFLDPDDAYYPEMIAKMLAALRNYRADVVECSIARCASKGRMEKEKVFRSFCLEREEVLSGKTALERLAIGRLSNAVWNKLYARRLWDKLRFPEGQVYEDISMTYQVFFSANRVALLPDVCIVKRARPGSITATMSLQNMRDLIKAHRQMEAFYCEHTPELFDEELTNTKMKMDLRAEICCYCRLPRVRDEQSDDVYNRIQELKEQCVLERTDVGSIGTRLACKTMRICPWGTWTLIRIYRELRIFLHRHIRQKRTDGFGSEKVRK